MRVAFVIASLNAGGAERVVVHLANAMAGKNIETNIILFNNFVQYTIDNSVNIEILSPKGKKANYVYSAVKMLRRKINEIAPDVVYSFMSETNVISILAGLGSNWKTIVSERQDPNVTPQNKMYRILRAATYSMSNGFVFQTTDAQRYFSKAIQKKSVIIHNPVNPPVAIKDNYELTNQVKICGVGRLTEAKNFKLLISSVYEVRKHYPGIKLTIYGEGKLRNELENQIKSLNMDDCVTLYGVVSNVPSYIKNEDIFVLSSDEEGMSNALMEALSVGLPVISTDCPIGGSKELIKDHYNGLLIPIKNKNAMVHAIEELIENNQLRKQCGINAQEINSSHALEAIVSKWIEYGVKIIGG